MATGLVYFRAFAGTHFVDAQLAAMAERVGVDLASTASIAQIEAMQEDCAGCQERARCLRWVRSSAPTGYEEFCLNTNILDRFWMETAMVTDRLREASFKTGVASVEDGPSAAR